MSPADWIILAIVVVCFILALRRINRNHKKGNYCSCGGTCAANENCSSCCSECKIRDENIGNESCKNCKSYKIDKSDKNRKQTKSENER